MLSVLIVAEEPSLYRELEECLINDFQLEFATRLPTNVVDLNRIEFSFEVVFYLKQLTYAELPSVLRLTKQKVMIFEIHSEENFPVKVSKLVPVAERVVLRASAMRGRIEYYRGVDEIAALNARHMECEENAEVILNGDATMKAYIGDIVFRVGKNIVFGVRKDNVAVFSADVFSNEPMSEGDNCRFLKNLLSSMLGSAELM
ncbi:MAG: hypothetical protein ABWW66_01845 [Archaeoglobaceae archaeon]